MSGSITESEACASEFDESWTPQQGNLQENYKFQWEPPWKNLNIKIRLANGNISEHTSFLLVPIKMQFLMKHSLHKIHQIIQSTKCCQVDSINSSKEYLEIKVNSSAADEIFNEVENYLVNEVDEVLLKPIQRFPYTSKLAEEYFKKGLKERSIDMLRDDSKIYIVGHLEQKDYIHKIIHEINRVTVTKIVKIDEKWKIEAIKAFAFIDKLTGTFPDILARIQPGQSSIFLQGKDVTIEKAENELTKLLSDLFNQNIQLDPLVLQLLTCKQASEILTCILEKDRIQVVWTIDKTQLCFLSKFIINVDVLKSILHEHFLTAGFSNSSQQSSTFCLSNAFLEITKTNEDRLLVFETTRSGINIAATKHIILELLHREKMFYTDSRNTRGIQVDEVSCEIQTISRENEVIRKKAEGLELKCKKSEDRCKTLETELKSEEEKAIRLAFEKQVTEETSRDLKSETTKQLKELRDICGEHNNRSISQQIEIDRLKTTNKKLADNLKTVKEELRSQVSTLEMVRRYFDDELKKIGKNMFEVQTDIYQQKTSSKAVVSIKAKTNTSVSVYLAANNQRTKILRKDSGVDVTNDDEGGITLTGDLCSIISARDILLSLTNPSTDIEFNTYRLDKEFYGKFDMSESNKQTGGRFHYEERGDRNNEPNEIRDSLYISDSLQNQFTKVSSLSQLKNNQKVTTDETTKDETFQDQLITDRPSNQLTDKSENIPRQMNPINSNGCHHNITIKPGENVNASRPTDNNVLKHTISYPIRGDTQVYHSSNTRDPNAESQEENIKEARTDLYPILNELNINNLEHVGEGTGAIRKYSKETNGNGTPRSMKRELYGGKQSLVQQLKQNANIYRDEKRNISGNDVQYNESFFKTEDDSIMMETKEGVKVFVYKADICYLANVDCIVNSSNSGMNHSKGLSEVIAKRAGKPMEDECRTYLRAFGTLSSDSICITSAGKLSHYKTILHVNAPNSRSNLKPEEFSVALSSSVYNCLNHANKERMTSCAFPAVSSGHGGILKDVCYSSYPTGVVKFSRISKKPIVKEVHFVDRDQDVVDLMQAAFLKAIREENKPSKGWKDKWFEIPQKTKDIFKSHFRDESQPGKYLELHLENRTAVIVCDGGLLNSLKHQHAEKVTRSVGYGQWKQQETVIVIPEDVEFSGKSQTAQKCLKRGGKSFWQNYCSVQAIQRKKIGSVLETYAGYDMDFCHVLFPILPKFSEAVMVKHSSAQTIFFEMLYQSFLKIFLEAEKSGYKHLSTPLFCADFYNNTDEWFMVHSTRKMMSAVRKFAISRQGKGFMIVHIVTDGNDKLFQILNKEMFEKSV